MPEIKRSELKSHSLAVKRPDLVELLVNKKDGLLTCGSRRKVRWWCENGEGHWFEMIVASRTRGHGCSVCRGFSVVPGFNDLSTVRPDISQHFNVEQTRIYAERYPEKKWALSPEKVTVKSNRYAVFWCDRGGEHWSISRVAARTLGHGCSVCAGKNVWVGFNDLASQQPDIARYFNVEQTRVYAERYPEKKCVLSLQEVTAGSNKWAVWDCENRKGHWYDMKVINRVTKKQGCPYCSGNRVLPCFNDLAFLRPDVAKLWDYQGNKRLNAKNKRHPQLPEELTVSSRRACLWLCDCGKTFKKTVKEMTRPNSLTSCPRCSETQGEKELAEFIADLLPEDMKLLRNDRTVLRPRELDVYIPALGLAFEFNGDYWHSNKSIVERYGETAEEYHQKKLDGCANQGIDLFFVWESDWNDSRNRVTIENYVKEILLSRVTGEKTVEKYSLLKILEKI